MQNRILAIMVAIVLAVVSALALVVYANSADRRALSQQSPIPVYVASQKIAQGEAIEDAAGKIRIVDLPRSALAEGAVRALTQISGKVAAVDILPGEQLIAGRWVSKEQFEGENRLNIQQGFQAVSIQVDATRQVSGFITPGNLVNLFATFNGAGGRFSRLLLPDVKVLAVGTRAVGSAGAAGARPAQSSNLSTVTLQVRDGSVEKVVFAAESGTLYLSLVAPGAKPPPSKESNLGNLFG
jgi:pilus assembly protein CpaB